MQFRLLGIPVYIHPTFWLFLLFFTRLYQGFSAEGFILGGVLFMSLLVHEYGHAFTAAYFGAHPVITLEGLGGYAQYTGGRITPKQHFLITLNGPLLESLLIVVPYFLLKVDLFSHVYMRYFLYSTMQLNMVWCVLNLIPIAPLDGGQLLRYFLEKKWGPKGYKRSLQVGLGVAAVVIPYLYLQGFSFFAVLLVFFVVQHLQLLKQLKVASGEDSGFNQYIKGLEAAKNNEIDKAKLLLKKLLKVKDSRLKTSAVEALAKLYMEQKEEEAAYTLLLKGDHQALKEGKCLLCKLAFERKNYELVSRYAREIYDIAPSYEIAVLNSQAFAALGDAAYAGAWLHTAAQFETVSAEEMAKVLEHPVYEKVKEHADFKHYVAT